VGGGGGKSTGENKSGMELYVKKKRMPTKLFREGGNGARLRVRCAPSDADWRKGAR